MITAFSAFGLSTSVGWSFCLNVSAFSLCLFNGSLHWCKTHLTNQWMKFRDLGLTYEIITVKFWLQTFHYWCLLWLPQSLLITSVLPDCIAY